jgi:peptide/nickel transport system permease protein
MSAEPMSALPVAGPAQRSGLTAQILRPWGVRAAAAVLGVIMAVAVLAPWIAPQNPFDPAGFDLFDNLLPPLGRAMAGGVYPFGTDDQGRDIFSAILYGLRVSLIVAVTSAVVAITIGVLVGLVSAYLGGRVDALLMRIVDIQLSFPAVLIALVLVAILGRGLDKTILALIVTQWAYYARTVRGVALAEMGKNYIEAARVGGYGFGRILLVHLLPNCLAPVIAVVALQVGGAIALESTLSFLGLGVPITQPSLGLLIANGFPFLMSGRWWMSVFPGAALLLLVVSITILSDRVREVLRPSERGAG